MNKVTKCFHAFFQGTVSCTFRAEDGGASIAHTVNTSLAVLAEPEVKVSPLKRMTVYNDTWFSITCDAFLPDTGHPDAADGVQFVWKRNDQEIIPDKSRFTSVQSMVR